MWLKYWLFYLLKILGSPHKAVVVPEALVVLSGFGKLLSHEE